MDTECEICHGAAETHEHLFYKCQWAAEIWRGIAHWLQIPLQRAEEGWFNGLLWIKGSKRWKRIIYMVNTAVIYDIWAARNNLIFHGTVTNAEYTSRQIKVQIIQRVLYIAQGNPKYTGCTNMILRERV